MSPLVLIVYFAQPSTGRGWWTFPERTLLPLGWLPAHGSPGVGVGGWPGEGRGQAIWAGAEGCLLSQRHQKSPVELSSKGGSKSAPSHSLGMLGAPLPSEAAFVPAYWALRGTGLSEKSTTEHVHLLIK